MKKLFLLLLTPFLINAQTKKEVIKPKGNWFFGVEVGNNTIISYEFNESKNSLQTGVLAEYSFNNFFSVSGRVKYFKTGVSFKSINRPKGHFDGSVICIPINANVNFNFNTKFYPTLKLGLAWNRETESNYTFTNSYSKTFISINLGAGLNYNLNKKVVIYSTIEGYFFGGYKGNSQSFLFSKNYFTENIVINLGVKRSIFK
jgi:opacity protein-like surface antigen